jgi:gliding motility-associated-like protein
MVFDSTTYERVLQLLQNTLVLDNTTSLIMKNFLSLSIVFILLIPKGITQNSYSLDLKSAQSNSSDFIVSFGLIPSGGGKSVLFFHRPASAGDWANMNMVNMNSNGTLDPCYEFELDSLRLVFSPPYLGIQKNGYYIVIPPTTTNPSMPHDDGSVVFLVNPELGLYKAWKRSIKNSHQFSTSALSSNMIMYCSQAMADTTAHSQVSPNMIGLSAVDLASEEILWNYRYMDSNDLGMPPLRISSLDGGDLVMLTNFSNRKGLVKLDETGQIKAAIEFHNNSFILQQMRSTSSGDLLVYGRGLSKGIIIKLNPSLEVIWSRLIAIDNFIVSFIEVSEASDDSIIFSCSTQGDFPIVLGRLNPDGQLLSNQGFAIQAVPEVDNEGALFFTTSFPEVFPDGSFEHHSLVIKTDPNGNIDNCPQFDACVTLEEIDIQTVPITVTREPIPHIEPTPVSVYPAEFYTEPYCVTPEPPNALFHLPARVCEGSCLSPDSIFNATANHVEWRILGTGLDTLIADTSFYWCFDTPGTYTVEQEVWVLGCSEFYARQLEVRPDDLTPPLMSDTILCQSPPYTLQPQSSRPLSSFLWSDGSTGSVLSVNQGGVITLEAGDGACSVRDTIELQFVEELIPQGPYTQPEDVGLCEQLLPYLYRPYSAYTSEFSLPGVEALPDGSFLLAEYGRYELSTELYGCPFSTAWELQELPCELPVYLPNAFSPNFDGINDHLEPQGIDFEPIRLQVFDRWGGLLFQTSQAPFRWDGLRANQAVNSGGYVVRFEYRNLRTGGVEEVVGEVVLLR